MRKTCRLLYEEGESQWPSGKAKEKELDLDQCTWRIFGAEEDDDETFERQTTKNYERSQSVGTFRGLPSTIPPKTLIKKRTCKSVGSLEDIRFSRGKGSKAQSQRASMKRRYLRRMNKTCKAVSSSYSTSLSEEHSVDISDHLEVSPCGSPNSSLSPSSPDKLGLLRSESPTEGMGQFHKGRSSSIATAGFPVHTLLIPSRVRSRRFSMDSMEPRRGKLRLLLSKQYKKVTNWIKICCQNLFVVNSIIFVPLFLYLNSIKYNFVGWTGNSLWKSNFSFTKSSISGCGCSGLISSFSAWLLRRETL